jgi:glycosyltransferase involved in cell wall biosynthesis
VKLFVAIPLLDELENIYGLLEDIRQQNYENFECWFCVNQPDEWHNLPEKKSICDRNMQTIDFLVDQKDLKIVVIDKSSIGKGWLGKNHGVGQARKVLMDSINDVASDDDIILSLDGDTHFSSSYFHSIINLFDDNPHSPAISNPYYHILTGKVAENRAILRYEIYMRYYELNLRRINSPYSFTALGSAIAVKIWAYRKIGGITPKKSGEDFYFLQKMIKFRPIMTKNTEIVFPAARFSDRVFFGTGPAMIKGAKGDWSSYPIYRFELFDEIKAIYDLFEKLYFNDIASPVDLLFEEGWAEKLRLNCRTKEVFVKACHDKFDGLRILQFLKEKQKNYFSTDEQNLKDFAEKFYPSTLFALLQKSCFSDYSVEELNIIRDFFVEKSK